MTEEVLRLDGVTTQVRPERMHSHRIDSGK